MKYSPSNNGFYDPKTHTQMPEDCIALGDDQYHQLLEDQSCGKIITVENGKVVAKSPPPPTAEQLFDDLRQKRDAMLEESDRTVLQDYPHPDEAAKQAWVDYRQALRDLPSNTEDPSNPRWPAEPSP